MFFKKKVLYTTIIASEADFTLSALSILNTIFLAHIYPGSPGLKFI